MKVECLNNTDTKWHASLSSRCPCSWALDIEFTPHHGPKVSECLGPPVDGQLLIFFETSCVSVDRMLHITPDETWLELNGRFLIQASGRWSSTPLPSFMRCQEYIEGKLLLNLGRDSTFRIEAVLGHAPHPTAKKELRVTIRFLGHCDHKERPHEH